MKADPVAFRGKYRTMASDPHAFYRGTACLFYADVRRPTRTPSRRAQRADLDPWRPARRELRHLPQLRRSPGLRRQRLRRGLPRPVHLGPPAVRGLAGARRLAEGAARGRRTPPRRALRAGLSRAGRRLPPLGRRRDYALHLDNTERSRSDALVDARLRRRADLLDHITVVTRESGCSATMPACDASKTERAKSWRRSRATSTRSRRTSASTAALLRPPRRGRRSPASGSAAPGCRRTTCSSRATARRSTTTSCCR